MSTQLEVRNEDRKRPRFLDVKELAEMLRLKTRTVYDMVSQGRIPYRKAGDRTIFLLDEILEWTKPHGEDS
jgi:excisionase family DNA binding protein